MNSISTVMVSIIRYGWHHPRCQVTATRWSLRRHSFQNPLTFTESPWVFFFIRANQTWFFSAALGVPKMSRSLRDSSQFSSRLLRCFVFQIRHLLADLQKNVVSTIISSTFAPIIAVLDAARRCLAMLGDSLGFFAILGNSETPSGELRRKRSTIDADEGRHNGTYTYISDRCVIIVLRSILNDSWRFSFRFFMQALWNKITSLADIVSPHAEVMEYRICTSSLPERCVLPVGIRNWSC